MIINYFLKDKIDPAIVLPYQNFASLTLSLYCIYILIDSQWRNISILDPVGSLEIYSNNNYWIDIKSPNTIMNIIFTHAITDIFFVNTELAVHHICIMLFISYKYIYNVESESVYFVKELISTEVSTLFYVLVYYLKDMKHKLDIVSVNKKSIQKVFHIMETSNLFLFFGSFFYTRIYNYFYTIIMNPNVNVLLHDYYDNNIISSIHIYSGLFGLYLLNLYWFIVMCKKIYKMLFSKYDSYFSAEWILQFFYFLNIPLAVYVYSFSSAPYIETQYYILDIMGIVFLSITSYYYHHSNYKGLINEGESFNCLNKSRVWYYVTDNFGITLRSFMCILTKSLIEQSPMFTFLTSVLFIQNVISFSHILYYLLNESLHNSHYLYNSISSEHSEIINFLIGSTIVFDTITISINSSRELMIYNCLIVYILVAVMIIKPFYKFNHLAIHALLLCETYSLCKVIIS